MNENIDPKTANENAEARKKEAIIRENENRARNDAMRKGVITTAIIGFVLLLITGIVAYSLYNRDHKLLLSQMEAQKNSYSETIT